MAALTLALLQGVVARLETRFDDMGVELFPDDPAQYRFSHPNGVLLVGYGGSDYDKPRDVGRVVQDRRATLPILIMLRQLNGEDGALIALDRLRDALQGFRPPNCRRGLQVQRDRFIGEDGGIWQYQMFFDAYLLAVSDEPDPVEALLGVADPDPFAEI